jgi:hypothetical protein
MSYTYLFFTLFTNYTLPMNDKEEHIFPTISVFGLFLKL